MRRDIVRRMTTKTKSPPAPEDRQVTLRMPIELWRALAVLAEQAERKPSAEIRLALKTWVKDNNPT